jgi:hypothetical protein
MEDVIPSCIECLSDHLQYIWPEGGAFNDP